MARLFITRREIDLINDINKELMKDIIGQYIIYWPISMLKTKVHDIYDEAIQKIFENPIKIDALVSQPNWETRQNIWGQEQFNKIEVYVHARDLIDKNITITEGDFFQYGNLLYEISSYINLGNLFGQAEYGVGYKITGILARAGIFDPKSFFKPYIDSGDPFELSQNQQQFIQQRGLPETEEGTTGDIRHVRERLGEDAPETALGEGPRKVSLDETKKSNNFYDE